MPASTAFSGPRSFPPRSISGTNPGESVALMISKALAGNTMPRLTSETPILYDPAAPIRTSPVEARMHPPAMACPLTATTSGRGNSRSFSFSFSNSSRNDSISSRPSGSPRRSSPAEKNPSWPVRTTAFFALSSARSSSAARDDVKRPSMAFAFPYSRRMRWMSPPGIVNARLALLSVRRGPTPGAIAPGLASLSSVRARSSLARFASARRLAAAGGALRSGSRLRSAPGLPPPPPFGLRRGFDEALAKANARSHRLNLGFHQPVSARSRFAGNELSERPSDEGGDGIEDGVDDEADEASDHGPPERDRFGNVLQPHHERSGIVEVGVSPREVGAERREEDENLTGEADCESKHHRLRQAKAPERPRERAEQERGEEGERHDTEDMRALLVGNAGGSENEAANRKENDEDDDELYATKVRAHKYLLGEAISIVEWPLSATSLRARLALQSVPRGPPPASRRSALRAALRLMPPLGSGRARSARAA